jgi:hypothetical protein
MTGTLISKIAAASLKVGALATDKRNVQQGYDYISADKILERAGAALAGAGVVIVPSIVSENTEAIKTDKGTTRYDSIVTFAMIVTDGETQLEMPWVGRGNDYSVPDKAMYKAITSGHRYFLAKLLNIGVGNEDGEHENEPQPTPRQQAQGARSQPQLGNHANGAANTPQRPVFEVEEGFDGPSDDELEILGTWSTPEEAKTWAIHVGACANEYEAKHSLKKIVDNHGGKLTRQNIAAVYLDFLRHQNAKVAA